MSKVQVVPTIVDNGPVAERVEQANDLIRQAHELLLWNDPVGRVQWIPIDRVQANDYNPNAVAHQEMRLLYTSVKEDGYTQPVVAVVEPRCDILLPCGHFSSLDQRMVPLLMTLCWGTPQGSLTAREASLHLPGSHTAIAGGASRSASQQEITAEISVNGSRISGALVTSTSNGDSALPTSGTSPGSEMSNTSWIHVCPICESSESAREQSWTASELKVAASGEEYGLLLKWISSENTDPASPRKPSQKPSDEASTPSVGNETPSGSLRLLVRDKSQAIIVDGFHRWTVMRKFEDIASRTSGYLPVVVLDKSPADRMASTIRHNRARGKHSVAGMGNLVFQMLIAGETDATICNKLGMEAEELARLKHITGYSKLYHDLDYSPPVLTTAQAKAKAKYKKEHPDEHVPNDF